MNRPTLGDVIRVLTQDLRAWRRGERRIAPRFDVNGRVMRGRIYAKRRAGNGDANVSARARVKGSMSFRVYRAATDTWEDRVEVPAVPEEKR